MHTEDQVLWLVTLCTQIEHQKYAQEKAFSYWFWLYLCHVQFWGWRRYPPSFLCLPLCSFLLANDWTSLASCWRPTGETFLWQEEQYTWLLHGNIFGTTWELWNLRNDKVFNGASVSRTIWIQRFKKQINLQLLRVKEIHHPPIVQWLDTIIYSYFSAFLHFLSSP